MLIGSHSKTLNAYRMSKIEVVELDIELKI